MKITLRALTQKVALVSSAFVLAVSTLTAAVPFILSSNVSAAPIVSDGGLVYSNITTEAELRAAITEGATTINLAASFTVDTQIHINRTLTLNGNGYTLTARSGWTGSGSNDTILAVVGGAPVLNNLTVDGANATGVQGIQVWNSTATLNAVTARNNSKAGIHINGGTVTLHDVTTSNNSRGNSVLGFASYGGILVTAGSVTITGMSTHTNENNHIRRDGGTVNDGNQQYTSSSIFGIYTRYTVKAAPAAPAFQAPTPAHNAVINTSPEVTVQWSKPTYADTFEYRINGGSPIATTTQSLTQNFANGTYTVEVRSVAKSGLVGNWSAARTFTLDVNSVPFATVDTPAVNGFASTKLAGSEDTLKIAGTFTDDEAVNYLQFELVKAGNLVTVGYLHYNNPGLNSDGTFVYNLPVPSGLTNGQYSLFFTGTDFENGVTARFERVFTIDNTAPTIYVKENGNDVPLTAAKGIYKNASFHLYDQYKVKKVVVNGVEKTLSPSTWSDLNNVKPGSFGGAEGSNTVVLYDLAGNTTSYSFVIDTIAPTTSITSNTVSGNAVNFSGTVSDVNLNYYYCYLTTNQTITVGGTTFNPGQEVGIRNSDCVTKWANGTTDFNGVLGGFNIAELPQGSYTINLVAYDRAGNNNAAAPATYTFDLDRTAPDAAITSVTTSQVSGTVGLDAVRVVVTVDGDDTEVTPENGVWSLALVPALTVGQHNITLTAYDASNNPGIATAVFEVFAPTTQDGEPEVDNGTIVINNNTAPVLPLAFSPVGAPDVQGAATENNVAEENNGQESPAEVLAAATTTADGKIWGLAWYWWLLILAGLATVIWGIIAAFRNRAEQN